MLLVLSDVSIFEQPNADADQVIEKYRAWLDADANRPSLSSSTGTAGMRTTAASRICAGRGSGVGRPLNHARRDPQNRSRLTERTHHERTNSLWNRWRDEVRPAWVIAALVAMFVLALLIATVTSVLVARAATKHHAVAVAQADAPSTTEELLEQGAIGVTGPSYSAKGCEQRRPSGWVRALSSMVWSGQRSTTRRRCSSRADSAPVRNGGLSNE